MNLTTQKPKPKKISMVCSFIAGDCAKIIQRAKHFIQRKTIPYYPPEHYSIPDSANCQRALEIVRLYSPNFLTNHSLRSHAFGLGMAYKSKTKVDREVFFMGAIMHDLGLTDHYDKGGTFELDGAVAAKSICESFCMSKENTELVHEMVALHNSVGIAHKLEPEIALLHYGAGADVAGLWIEDLHPKTIQEILLEYPRDNFKKGMTRLLVEQIRGKPFSYMATLMELGFEKKIEDAPFEE